MTQNIMKRPVYCWQKHVGQEQDRSFCFLVINVCNHGEHYETPCISTFSPTRNPYLLRNRVFLNCKDYSLPDIIKMYVDLRMLFFLSNLYLNGNMSIKFSKNLGYEILRKFSWWDCAFKWYVRCKNMGLVSASFNRFAKTRIKRTLVSCNVFTVDFWQQL